MQLVTVGPIVHSRTQSDQIYTDTVGLIYRVGYNGTNYTQYDRVGPIIHSEIQ